MATNLKKNKTLRKFLAGMLLFTSLIGILALCLLQPGMVQNLAVPELWVGNPIALPEFRTYATDLYNNYTLVATGVGDDEGTPLLNLDARQPVYTQALGDLVAAVAKANGGLLLYCSKEIAAPGGTHLSNYQGGSLFSQSSDAHLTLPAGYTLLFSTGNQGQAEANTTLLAQYRATPYQNRAPAGDTDLVIALPPFAAVQMGGNGYLYSLWQTAGDWQRAAILLAVLGVVALASALLYRRNPVPAPLARAAMAAKTAPLWTEAKLAAFCLALLLPALLSPLYFHGTAYFVACLLPCAALVYILLCDFWHNRRRLVQGSLVYRGLAALGRGVAAMRAALPWQRRAMAFCGLAVILLPPLSVVALCTAGLALQNVLPPVGAVLVLLLVGAYWAESVVTAALLVRESALLGQKITALQAGGVGSGSGSTPLPAATMRLLGGPAAALNELESGIDTALARQMQAERMKVELVSNVSHDLKTPLTSIISYADLLCAEELPPAAADYAKVVQKKAYQLRGMVQDVFELSKATSGNLPIAPRVLDMAKLIRQTLADMADEIAASGLTIRTELPEEAWICADGQRLYRVFQNLIDNALRYSLAGSRVYLRLRLQGGNALAEMKNVSRWELDFDPAEIVERFVRADASRTTTGSGLGLSIAKSFTEACGGSFAVTLDADLFCVSITLPLAEKPAQAAAPILHGEAGLAEGNAPAQTAETPKNAPATTAPTGQ
ncbi:MAG: HAMP domain-containing sensor histidine kinase [Gemmiger sp.]|nr:HAMP domain-containing sensor histidine kinase [Gemmiger sp.]